MSFSLPLFITFIEKMKKIKIAISKKVLKNNNYWKTRELLEETTLTLQILLMDILVANI